MNLFSILIVVVILLLLLVPIFEHFFYFRPRKVTIIYENDVTTVQIYASTKQALGPGISFNNN